MEDFELNPRQEHYLKRELLRFQLDKELECLNDITALREFGYPFTKDDPKQLKYSKKGPAKKVDFAEKMKSIHNSKFPMISYILREFIMSFPLLSKNIAVDESFWQGKVQIFFEHFMSLGFSESYDREQATKRKKIGQKITKIILLLFNSGIGSSKEVSYYDEDTFILQKEKTRKRSKIEEFAIPTRKTLQYLVTNEPMFINNWDINIVSVVDEVELFGKKKATPVSSSSSSSSINRSVSGGYMSATSKWMKSTFTMPTNPVNIFSKLSISGANGSSVSKRRYYFIIKTKSKLNPDDTTYVAKSYNDFKALAHNLKIHFPGKKLPNLPHKTKKSIMVITRPEVLPNGTIPSTPKEKVISSFDTSSIQISEDQSTTSVNDSNDETASITELDITKVIEEKKREVEQEEEDDDDESKFEEFQDASDSKTSNLAHERMRTSLRQYLRSLSRDTDVSASITLSNFFNDSPLDSIKFTNLIKEDISNREGVDINNLETQLQFQKLALEKSLVLQESMKEFKSTVLKDENYVLSLVQEIKTKKSITELNPLSFNFVEWCKIYISSMIYQVFLGNDNSYGFYTQVRRLHRLMPYTMMSQIMKFTNPMAIMKGMIDLFMTQPLGGRSLLQTMFSTILNDDLRSQKSVIKKLETVTLNESSNACEVINCLKNAIFNQQTDDIDSSKVDNKFLFDMQKIHDESDAMDMPVCLIVLMKSVELKVISEDAVSEVIESYSLWKVKEAEGSYFQHIKELLQLYIKERDKRLMRQLWQDPELSQLLKAIITMIYEPMVKIFKIARMDIALKNFERFMTDLIKLMDDVINGQIGTNTEFNVIESINELVTKHQDSFFEFVHDVYLNDSEGIFEGFILWVTDIIKFLQKSKYGNAAERINFDELVSKTKDIDPELLKKQIDDVITKKMNARKLYSQIVDSKTDDVGQKSDVQKVVAEKWRVVNSVVMPKSSMSLGLNDGELVDLDLDTKDYDFLNREGDLLLERKYQELLSQRVEEGEIKKLTSLIFEPVLRDMLTSVD